MYQLQLLGAVNLRPIDGGTTDLPQPKRLALLCYLLLAIPRGFRSRDELLAIFWPESDHSSGRTSLRKAIHGLRKALDRRAIESARERIRADPDRVDCDAVRFEEAVDSGRFEDALALYRGDLMPGFHVSGLPAFERWLETERQRLRRTALDAAVLLADRAEADGDMDAAAGWAWQTVRIEPFGEANARHAATLLRRAGRRADAIRLLEQVVRRLRDEWEVEPASATVDLLESVRRSPDPATPQAAESRDEPEPEQADPPIATGAAVRATTSTDGPDGQAPAVSSHWRKRRRFVLAAALLATVITPLLLRRDTAAGESGSRSSRLAVLPFEAEDAAAAGWSDALGRFVASNLDSFEGIEVLDPAAVDVPAAAITDGDSERTALMAAVDATGVTGIITGSVIHTDGRLLASIELWDRQRARWSGPIQAQAPPDSLVALADQLTVKLVAGWLARQDTLSPGDLHEGSTHSMAALRAYIEGESYFRSGQWPEAAVRFLTAVEQEPSFAMAYFRLGETHRELARPDVAQLFRTALAIPDRLRARDRSLIRGALLTVERRREAVDTLRALTGRQPFDAEAWNQLGAAYFHVGRRVLATPADYRLALGRAIELEPHRFQPYLHLVEDAFFTADEARARELIEGLHAFARETTYGPGYDVALGLAWGGAAERRRAIEALDTLSPRLRGPLDRAMTLLELNAAFQAWTTRVANARLLASADEAGRESTENHLLRMYERAGRVTEGLEILRSRLQLHGTRRWAARVIVNWHVLGFRGADPIDDALAVLLAAEDPTVRERFWLGAHALTVGDASLYRTQLEALRTLATTIEAPGDPGTQPPDPARGAQPARVDAPPAASRTPAYVGLVADALQALGLSGTDPDRAIALLKRAHDSTDPEITDDNVLDHIRYRLGRLYRETGRYDLAIRHFLAQNHHADQYVALLELELARTYTAMGHDDRARPHYERFAGWWAACDPVLHHLRDEALAALGRSAS